MVDTNTTTGTATTASSTAASAQETPSTPLKPHEMVSATASLRYESQTFEDKYFPTGDDYVFSGAALRVGLKGHIPLGTAPLALSLEGNYYRTLGPQAFQHQYWMNTDQAEEGATESTEGESGMPGDSGATFEETGNNFSTDDTTSLQRQGFSVFLGVESPRDINGVWSFLDLAAGVEYTHNWVLDGNEHPDVPVSGQSTAGTWGQGNSLTGRVDVGLPFLKLTGAVGTGGQTRYNPLGATGDGSATDGETTVAGLNWSLGGMVELGAGVFRLNPKTYRYYQDNDRDGYGNPDVFVDLPKMPATGYVTNNDDCNDTLSDPANDCRDKKAYYPDLDGDGFGDSKAESVLSATPIPGKVTNNDDCDDKIPAIENGNDCREIQNYFPDVDGDGLGDKDATPEASKAKVAGKVTNNKDCKDTDSQIGEECPVEPPVAAMEEVEAPRIVPPPAPVDNDPDKDGLTTEEERELGTEPEVADSDGDGMSDGLEVNAVPASAADNVRDDELQNYVSAILRNFPRVEGADYKLSNPLNKDSDQDGIGDTLEVELGTDPMDLDSDNDMISDGVELTLTQEELNAGRGTKIDTDGDGTLDALDDNSDGDDYSDTQEAHKKNVATSSVVTSYANLKIESNEPAFRVKKSSLVTFTGDAFTLGQQVKYKTNSHVIDPSSYGLLNDLADAILAHPEVTKIQVAGFTDTVGGTEYNQGLSERRAKSVVDYLTSHGVPASRLSSVGYGEASEHLKVQTADNVDQPENRRVEVTVLEAEDTIRIRSGKRQDDLEEQIWDYVEAFAKAKKVKLNGNYYIAYTLNDEGVVQDIKLMSAKDDAEPTEVSAINFRQLVKDLDAYTIIIAEPTANRKYESELKTYSTN